ncbi:hypothetical protein [Candidatus Deianiraea vastatrix]|uniref:Uncharacterized protein n=1 Tax=Candidatus Deianiraea vastatrix TaxID=2163644 RepID=A0A5B8XEA4_9RICK|nr:hypothetical protein [Candidatus Deianiraea vastatrix]QED23648.1 hypothetical protein Deia_00861 [Candidatus Deianiraea vastatrix]
MDLVDIFTNTYISVVTFDVILNYYDAVVAIYPEKIRGLAHLVMCIAEILGILTIFLVGRGLKPLFNKDNRIMSFKSMNSGHYYLLFAPLFFSTLASSVGIFFIGIQRFNYLNIKILELILCMRIFVHICGWLLG